MKMRSFPRVVITAPRRPFDHKCDYSVVLVSFFFLVEAVASQSPSTSSSPYSRPGPYAVATARLEILAAWPTPGTTASGDGDGGVPGASVPADAPAGEEEGEVVVYYPTTTTTTTAATQQQQRRQQWARAPPRGFPLAIYVHPTHGFLFETWTSQNDAMLRLLASRGVVVVSPVRVGDPLGVGPSAPVIGGLMPGAQSSAEVTEQRVYPRLQRFVLHALMQVARRGEEDPAFFAPLRGAVDASSTAIMGFSAGGALAVYATEESQRVWPGRVRAVIALAPTTGDTPYGDEQFDLRAKRLTVPLLLTSGRDDDMGGFEVRLRRRPGRLSGPSAAAT